MSRRLVLPLLALALAASVPVARADDDAPAADDAADASTDGAAAEKADEPAGPVTSVVVLPYAPVFGEIPQSTADKATDLVTNELKANDKQFKVVDPAEGKAKKGGKTWEDDLAQAKGEVESALKQFEKAAELAKNKKPKPAADAYEKGIQQFLVSFQGADDFKALSEAYLQLSITRFKLGDEDQSMKLLDDLIRVDPSRVLQPGEVVNLFAKLHDKQRTAYLAKPRAELKVLSTPAGARVTLDGKDIGETPLLAKGIVPGEHYLKVVKAGEGAFWKKVLLTSNDSQTVTADLAGAASGPLVTVAKALAQNGFDDKVAAEVQKIGEASKADYVLFGAIHKGDDVLNVKSFALRVKDGTATLLAPLSFDTEMLGAGIEVFKLASDLGEKVKAFEGAKPDGEVKLFADAEAPKADDNLNVVTVTGAGGSPQVAANGDEGGTRRRGPVTHQDDSVKPVEEKKPVVAENDDAGKTDAPAVEERKPVIRQRGKIGEEPPAPKKVAEEPKHEDEPVIVKKDTEKKSVLDDVVAEETGDKKPKTELETIDLSPKSKKADLSALSPEELKKMQDLENKDDSSSSTGKILLWSGVGVVGAAGLGYLGYVLLSPKTPTSATAHVTWSP